MQQRRAKHPDAEAGQGRAGVDARHFLPQDLAFGRGQARTAIGLGPFGHGIALVAARLEPGFLRIAFEAGIAAAPIDIALVTDGFTHFGWAGGLEPFTRFRAEGFQIAVGHVPNPLF